VTIDPKEISVQKLHAYLLGAVIPRPIAFVSTIDLDGNVNLSPFSFFNVFSSNPPVMVFSPSRRGRENTTKHTYDNVKKVPEAVVNIVNYSMVGQASLASGEFQKNVNEFVKAGFTPVDSKTVRPPRVKESPVSFECKVNQVIELGSSASAGNLVICEVLSMHIDDSVLDAEGRIDPIKLDAVARMGQDFYCRVIPESIFKVPRPGDKPGIGFDSLPQVILNSSVLTGNDLAALASVVSKPGREEVQAFAGSPGLQEALRTGVPALHTLAQEYVRNGQVNNAWKVLLTDQGLA
jgi:flavin reductase (DIM6/NTAB) family NADH-FMN oxidoreductase RutF